MDKYSGDEFMVAGVIVDVEKSSKVDWSGGKGKCAINQVNIFALGGMWGKGMTGPQIMSAASDCGSARYQQVRRICQSGRTEASIPCPSNARSAGKAT